MTAYPLLEALLLPAFVVAAALAYPRLARAVAARLAPGELEVDARTFVATSAGGLAIVGWLGLGALGPALVTERGWTGALFACAAALLFVGRAHAVGRSLAWAPRGGGWLAGLVLGLGLLLVVVGARRVVAVEPGAAATTSMARARWALRFDPWDGEAYLAAAW
ncbi:MAG: hypothetical protein KF901_30895, partial [Myxococcales bacterium]|nr:hypothetical protein [Myxococcales bacterium]